MQANAAVSVVLPAMHGDSKVLGFAIEIRDLATFFTDMQRQELRKGGPVSRRSADSHKLIRYQRNGIARLSRAVRQG